MAMNDLSLGPRSKHRKCAKIVGDTGGNYHPHGDQATYGTLVRLAQDWNMRYPLVDPQGNFGSIDDDPPAAMRYTEARMTAAATDMLEDLKSDTVDFVPNYDETPHRADCSALKVSKPAGQRLHRHRRRNGNKYSSSQYRRGMRCSAFGYQRPELRI